MHVHREESVEFVRGDMYLTQMKATKGHVALVNCVEWHPVKRVRSRCEQGKSYCSHVSSGASYDLLSGFDDSNLGREQQALS